jgi:hypothetical protein
MQNCTCGNTVYQNDCPCQRHDTGNIVNNFLLKKTPAESVYVTVSLSNGCGPGSSVGIATDYGLDGLGIVFRWRRDFSYTSRPVMGPTQPPVQWVLGLSRG